MLAFGHLCENRVQAGVENLGGGVTVNIPSNWSITSRDAVALTAQSPSQSITLIVRSLPAASEKTITVADYDALNLLLEPLLNSEELATINAWTIAGFPLTKLSSDPTFSGGYYSAYMFYSAYVIRTLSLTDYQYEYDFTVTHKFLTDGTNNFLVKLIVSDQATQDEINKSIQAMGSFTSTKITSPLGDSDGDGVNNFDEVILYGTNPNSADIPQGTTYQGPTITSDLSRVSVPVSRNIIPYAVTTNFGANAFTATGLPLGIKINAKTGVITGKPTKKGRYTVRVTASKKQGKAVTNSVMTSKSVIVY